MSVPAVWRHVNRRISGDPDCDWLDFVRETYFDDRLPLPRVLSLGCGAGALERRMARDGWFEQCEAIDLSEVAIQRARDQAAREGLKGIRYELGDLNALELPEARYDLVIASMSIHHCEQLEQAFTACHRGLKQGGLFVLNEYVGPSRWDFGAQRLAQMDALVALLPSDLVAAAGPQRPEEMGATVRRLGAVRLMRLAWAKYRSGTLLETLRRRLSFRDRGQKPGRLRVSVPTPAELAVSDPSESVRSAEIERVLSANFDVVGYHPYGGGMLQFALHGVAGSLKRDDARAAGYADLLCRIESTLEELGDIPSDFAVLVACPQRG